MMLQMAWKEYREHRPVWLAMAALGALLVIGMAVVLPALETSPSAQADMLNVVMAAVGAVYTMEAFPRTADAIVDEVARREAARRRPQPQNKHVRAELLVGKVALFLWLADEILRRLGMDAARERLAPLLSDARAPA